MPLPKDIIIIPTSADEMEESQDVEVPLVTRRRRRRRRRVPSTENPKTGLGSTVDPIVVNTTVVTLSNTHIDDSGKGDKSVDLDPSMQVFK